MQIEVGGNNRNGFISWDDADGNGTANWPTDFTDRDDLCYYFCNVYEIQASVTPQKVANVPYPIGFDFKRDRFGRAWKKMTGGNWEINTAFGPLEWIGDDISNTDEDLTVSDQSHIYAVDGPGYTKKERSQLGDYAAQFVDFREYVIATIYGTPFQISDFLKWHSVVYLKPKNATELTRDAANLQKLGQGWIPIPANP